MQALCYVLPGLVLGIIHYILLNDKKTIWQGVKDFLEFGLGYNIAYLGFQKFYLHQWDLLDKEQYTWQFSLNYIYYAFVWGFIYLFIRGVISKKLELEPVKEQVRKQKIITNCLKVLVVVFIAIEATFRYFANWFVDYFGNITPEQFFFNLKAPLKGTAGGMVEQIITGPVLIILTNIILAIVITCFSYNVYLNFKGKRYKVLSQKIYNIVIVIIAALLMINGISYGSQRLQLKEIAKSYFAHSTYIEDNYVDPRDVKMSFPKQKRNLIHIYLESMENSYLSRDLGGYMETNLIPELTDLLNEGDTFSNNDVFGGPNQIYGSSWSIASMMNMMAGIPLKIAEYGTNGSFLPGIIAIGDILEAEDYNQTIMFGSDIDFGGLSTYFKEHGNFKQFDLKYAKQQGLIPEDYNVWWGFEDEKLFEYAKQEITRLFEEGKPFNFTMETADTHFPDGWLSPNAPTPYDQQYANVIAFSSKQASDFINWIKEQPFYENTTIVVTGDHLSMDENFFRDWDPNYRRSIYNVILNADCPKPELERMHNREYAPFDFYPTILASMGVKIKGDRLGLGTNLYSNKKTLIERDGIDKVNEQLGLNSEFYMNKFIDKKGTSVFKTNNVTIIQDN